MIVYNKCIKICIFKRKFVKEEAKLLYVAITRAKRGLILSYTAEKTELLLEVDESLYDERELK